MKSASTIGCWLDTSPLVAEASVGKGLVMKRFQTRGRGRAAGIVKPFAHLTIVVRERAEAEDK